MTGTRQMRGMGRARFLAEARAIRAELAAHWPIKAIWEKRAARVGLSYRQFWAYARALRREMAAAPASSGPPASAGRRERARFFTASDTASDTEGGRADHAERQHSIGGPDFRHAPAVTDERADDILGPGFTGAAKRR
jgi:hypothetical protein